jgi:DNA-binding MarR family transcriptional regulator
LARLAASTEGQLGLIELAATGLSRSGVSRVVDRLEERQLVLRRTPQVDRRTIIVEVTDAGEELMLQLLATFERSATEHVARLLTTEYLAMLQLRLEKVASGIGPPQPGAANPPAGAKSVTCC